MKTIQIRQMFLDYFVQLGHEMVPSSSLVPGTDPTLLFTNSGMVQFKDVFLGTETRSYKRAVTAQRCVRAGGKHNDLENVGYTARHHTFFEMLGNFSFGDYFKEEAIRYSWELLTKVYGLLPEKLLVTVFEEDYETEAIWINQIGMPADKVVRIGTRDNFWQMGDTGPCGPCSEIFYDHGPDVKGGPPGSLDQDGDRYVEIWNLVFIQFNRNADGSLETLPTPCVDTGMGLERIAAVLQHVHSNYDIDIFQNLIRAAASVIGIQDLQSKSLSVIADHIRSTALLIVDGVVPSNEGRGYVLRRIIRRAVRHGYQCGCRRPFMHKLVDSLITEMGDSVSELAASSKQVKRILKQENEKFNETLEQGLKLLDQEIAKIQDGCIPAEVVFKLYDTYGFPADLTADVAREHDLTIDYDGFQLHMEDQRRRARAASRFVQDDQVSIEGEAPTPFVGYQSLEQEVRAKVILVNDQPCSNISRNQKGVLILNHTPFYAESGGQVGDRGTIKFPSGEFQVEDTRYLANKVVGHYGKVISGEVYVNKPGKALVKSKERQASANNHSATHLLHAALRVVLGPHIEQKGSLVDSKRLRFDFSHYEAIDSGHLTKIEAVINDNIRANHEVSVQTMDLNDAKEAGAAALFGEKYDAQVRTIRMGEFSFELCGGTHVKRTGDIGYCKIISETAIAAGVRRIEALTGPSAESYISSQIALVQGLSVILKTRYEKVSERVQALIDANRLQQKQIKELQAKLASGEAQHRVREIRGVKIVTVRQDSSDARSMRLTIDQWRNKLGSGVVVVGGINNEKVILLASVSKDLIDQLPAGKLIGDITGLVGGKGGGRPEMAQGGGPRVKGIEAALEAAYSWVDANCGKVI